MEHSLFKIESVLELATNESYTLEVCIYFACIHILMTHYRKIQSSLILLYHTTKSEVNEDQKTDLKGTSGRAEFKIDTKLVASRNPKPCVILSNSLYRLKCTEKKDAKEKKDYCRILITS